MPEKNVAPPLAEGTLETEGFVVVEWTDEGGHPAPMYIAPWHVHNLDDEAWYVLEGVLNVAAGDKIVEVRAGSGVTVPMGTPHTYWNPGPGPARYLLVMTPRIHRLIGEIHKLQDRSLASVQDLFRQCDSELPRQPEWL